MKMRVFGRLAAGVALCAGAVLPHAAAAAAYLFWMPPNFAGAPVKGDEPGLGLPMPGAKPDELSAHLLWNMRAGLNVAALQCQFAGPLMTVKNYNTILKQHSKELNDAYLKVSGYFKRTGGPKWQVALDQYTTRTYNGFSTLHAQLGFCESAGAIGKDALLAPRGQLQGIAETRMREFRNSLVPVGDRLFAFSPARLSRPNLPSLSDECWDKKDRLKDKCYASWVAAGGGFTRS